MDGMENSNYTRSQLFSCKLNNHFFCSTACPPTPPARINPMIAYLCGWTEGVNINNKGEKNSSLQVFGITLLAVFLHNPTHTVMCPVTQERNVTGFSNLHNSVFETWTFRVSWWEMVHCGVKGGDWNQVSFYLRYDTKPPVNIHIF